MRSTTMGACRLLLLCVFCTLWGGAVWADEARSPEESVQSVAEKAKAEKEFGEKAVTAQAVVVESAAKLLKELEGALTTAKAAVKDKDKEKAKDAIDAVEKAVGKAKAINITAEKVDTDVKAANKKSKEVLEEAQKKTTGTDDAADMKEKAAALKKLADKAVELWQTAQGKATLQPKEATDALTEVETAKKATDEAVKQHENEQDVKPALVALQTALESLTTGAKKPDFKAEAAKQAVDEAHKASTQTAHEAENLVKATNPGAHEKEITSGDSSSSTQKQPGAQGGENGKGEVQDSDKNRPPKKPEGDQSSTDGRNKNDSTSSSTHENNSPDGAHGGAIATCTVAPLLLLLTAVAYAAVC